MDTGPVVINYATGLEGIEASLAAEGVEVAPTLDGIARSRVVCVVSRQPITVVNATAKGFHGVIYDAPENRYFSWHLRARSESDLLDGIRYRLKEWRHKHGLGV